MLLQLPVLNSQLPTVSIVQQVKQDPPKPIEYTIQAEDTLTSIAESHGETAQRLFDKNLNISSPDVIIPGQKLNIPLKDEKLDDRPFPVTIEATGTSTKPDKPSISGGFSVSGNMYTPGQCTAYAWSRRPDLPGNLGDAWTWASNASAQGYTVSDTPRVGAIGVARSYSHVVYIEAVNGNTVSVSEQNYKGPFVVSTRIAPISEFRYIL